MTDETPKKSVRAGRAASEEEELVEDESPALKALLKRSLAEPQSPASSSAPKPEAVLLASVQQKLRKRSKGKFYGDGWSTTQARFSYALIAAIMLVTIVAIYLVLGPTGISR